MLNPTSERQEWLEILRRELPDERIQLWPDIDDPDSVDERGGGTVPRG